MASTSTSRLSNIKVMLFGLSSGLGYAIAKAITRKVIEASSAPGSTSTSTLTSKTSTAFQNEAGQRGESNDSSLIQAVQSKFTHTMDRIKTKIIVNYNNNILWLCCGYSYFLYMVTAIGAPDARGNNATAIVNGTLPLFYYYIVHRQHYHHQQQQQNHQNHQNQEDDEQQRQHKSKKETDDKVNNKSYEKESIAATYSENSNTNDVDTSRRQSRSRSNSVLTQTSEISTTSDLTPKQSGGAPNENGGNANKNNTRYIEMLVHNVSHTDLVLCLGIPNLECSSTDSSNDNATAELMDKIMTPRMDNKTTAGSSTNTKIERIQMTSSDKFNSTSPTSITAGTESQPHGTKKVESAAHALCRPRFSAFDMFCRRILNVLQQSTSSSTARNTDSNANSNGIIASSASSTEFSSASASSSLSSAAFATSPMLLSSIMSFPRYERSDSTPRFSLVTPRPSRQSMLPVGMNLSQLVSFMQQQKIKNDNDDGSDDTQSGLNISCNDLQSLRLRGKDVPKLDSSSQPLLNLNYLSQRSLSSPSNQLRQNEYNEEKNCVDRSNHAQSMEMIPGDTKTPLHLEAVFFPLLSSLLRRWSKQISEKYPTLTEKNRSNVKQVIILVTGVGTPRNWTHSKNGNSTKLCAEIMEFFIKVLYPHVTVVKLHSEREIYRYDENITFANKELLPCIDAYRDAHARGMPYPDESDGNDWATINSIRPVDRYHFDPDWKQSFSVTLSFADGAPARTYAIQSALRSYRPTYFHFWQLKTFWHDSKICDDDIEVHPFESMETAPAMEINKTSSSVQMVVDEMHKFRQFFVKRLKEENNDIRKFWLRKSKKPVLAVLLVNKPGEGLVLYRGTNMEVSMPTGSLCAERNVIGTALANDPGLTRENLMMVAVLAVPLRDEDQQARISLPFQTPSSPPPGVNQNICTIIDDTKDSKTSGSPPTFFLSEVEEKLTKYQRPENIRRSMSVGSFASIIECDNSSESDESWVKEAGITNPAGFTEEGGSSTAENARVTNVPPIKEIIPEKTVHDDSSNSTNPVRKIRLYNDDENDMNDDDTLEIKDVDVNQKKPSKTRRKKKRTVLVHSVEDINPLKPCGACNEWLKKIAESNPHFKIITFTDADCNGVYVTPCQE